MFWDNYVKLCNARRKSPSGVAASLGYTNSAVNKWKNGSVPQIHTRMKIAEYFNVPVEHLIEGITEDDIFLATVTGEHPLPPVEGDPEAAPRIGEGIKYRMANGATPPEPTDDYNIRINDNALLLDCIPKGATVHIRRTTKPEPNDITALLIDGEFIVRHFKRDGDIIVMSPSNPKYESIIVKGETIRKYGNGIVGVVDKVSFTL